MSLSYQRSVKEVRAEHICREHTKHCRRPLPPQSLLPAYCPLKYNAQMHCISSTWYLKRISCQSLLQYSQCSKIQKLSGNVHLGFAYYAARRMELNCSVTGAVSGTANCCGPLSTAVRKCVHVSCSSHREHCTHLCPLGDTVLSRRASQEMHRQQLAVPRLTRVCH